MVVGYHRPDPDLLQQWVCEEGVPGPRPTQETLLRCRRAADAVARTRTIPAAARACGANRRPTTRTPGRSS
ncbi:hypothetical protein Q0Z83_033420 [Actinoplanes sichuanensis]|nr:hypothetical protein Q0Z83_033420 [Actinoplanes sichuanensis]